MCSHTRFMKDRSARDGASGFQLRQAVDHSVSVLLVCGLTLLSGMALVAASLTL